MTAQSPLFPDIVPEPDESKWEITDECGHILAEVTGRREAMFRAQALADGNQTNVFLSVAGDEDSTDDEIGELLDEAECVRPFGLPW